MKKVMLVDCTLRDGGYYNSWDFSSTLIQEYLRVMSAIAVDFVEIGFRGFGKEGFKGACAYSTDSLINSWEVPEGLKLGVMVNASELVNYPNGVVDALTKLFVPAKESPVTLVRIACHVHEFEAVLPGCLWLKEQGYIVGLNLMQIANLSSDDIIRFATLASDYPIDILYFADSMGGLSPEQTSEIISLLRKGWKGELGIHTHDNMGQALANSLRAVEEGVTWIDGTVTGMGRGPGNAKMEYLLIELEQIRKVPYNITSLMGIIQKFFKPMQQEFGWGTNTYYYLAGKYGIHPTYIQQMLNDSRYNEEEILAVIDHLKSEGGKKFNVDTLEAARNFYAGEPQGTWNPEEIISGRQVVILGTGPGVIKHRHSIEAYLRRANPFVIALNTQTSVDINLIDVRAACHPVRLLADCALHTVLPQPLIAPASMLPKNILEAYRGKQLLDFGIAVQEKTFKFYPKYCILPTSLVIAYALSIATSGKASRILLAGFDGYGSADPRTLEVDNLLSTFSKVPNVPQLIAITPTQYKISSSSVYAL